jgi:hypothetical protein
MVLAAAVLGLGWAFALGPAWENVWCLTQLRCGRYPKVAAEWEPVWPPEAALDSAASNNAELEPVLRLAAADECRGRRREANRRF